MTVREAGFYFSAAVRVKENLLSGHRLQNSENSLYTSNRVSKTNLFPLLSHLTKTEYVNKQNIVHLCLSTLYVTVKSWLIFRKLLQITQMNKLTALCWLEVLGGGKIKICNLKTPYHYFHWKMRRLEIRFFHANLLYSLFISENEQLLSFETEYRYVERNYRILLP